MEEAVPAIVGVLADLFMMWQCIRTADGNRQYAIEATARYLDQCEYQETSRSNCLDWIDKRLKEEMGRID
tara:strand:+ start:293 stop:502 length:210 start_codon:yes stop_codon:yes gene_type:complete